MQCFPAGEWEPTTHHGNLALFSLRDGQNRERVTCYEQLADPRPYMFQILGVIWTGDCDSGHRADNLGNRFWLVVNRHIFNVWRVVAGWWSTVAPILVTHARKTAVYANFSTNGSPTSNSTARYSTPIMNPCRQKSLPAM